MPARDNSHRQELERLQRFKSGKTGVVAVSMGEGLVDFFKHSVERRHAKFCSVAQAWSALVPPMLNDHCALESFSKGMLTVIVDSSSHLYQLKQLLLAGLQSQILLAGGPAGLRKIKLRHGRWYHGDAARDRRVSFSP